VNLNRSILLLNTGIPKIGSTNPSDELNIESGLLTNYGIAAKLDY
jgi:hypothetical protein